MLGSGLTDAGNCLSKLKNSNDRFYVNLKNEEQSSALNDARNSKLMTTKWAELFILKNSLY
ncbi:hypothetical protein DXN04_31750 [Chitinophaga silvisoli]|uniref:Uncharacterized protein n=1 Tax=Chitinophaga silvisoli TaxID=2291814 RepID=A0A3E1NSL1_9BACT|nr:hypothetical protein DXN04_31750 [Chitinophaga silvisoli]